MSRGGHRRWPPADVLALGAALVLAGLAVGARVHELRRELWTDEVLQTLDTLRSPTLLALRERLRPGSQLLLDYALRAKVWMPLLGHSERALRLPSLAYGLCSPLVVGVIAFRRLRASTPRYLAWIGTLTAAAWCAFQAAEVHYSAEARLYSLVSLLSFVWTASFVLSTSEAATRSFRLLSLLFLQVHFFAAPLVASAYALYALEAWARRQRGIAARRMAELAAMLALTAWINWPTLEGFRRVKIFVDSAPPDPAHWVVAAARLVVEYARYAAPPAFSWWLWLAVATAAALVPAAATRRSGRRLALLAYGTMPLLFLVIRAHSVAEFSHRYFMATSGVVMATIVLAFEAAPWLLERVMVAAPDRARPAVAAVGAYALAVALVAGGSLPRSYTLPAANFSSTYRLFERLKASGRPLFVVANWGWSSWFPDLYWHWMGATPRALEETAQGVIDIDKVPPPLGPDVPDGQRLARVLAGVPAPYVVVVQLNAGCAKPVALPHVECVALGDNRALVLDAPSRAEVEAAARLRD